jgi:hypothetical protein
MLAVNLLGMPYHYSLSTVADVATDVGIAMRLVVLNLMFRSIATLSYLQLY